MSEFQMPIEPIDVVETVMSNLSLDDSIINVGSDDESTITSPNPISITFWADKPGSWLDVIDTQLRNAGVIDEKSKYDCILDKLTLDVKHKLNPITSKNYTENNSYKLLINALTNLNSNANNYSNFNLLLDDALKHKDTKDCSPMVLLNLILSTASEINKKHVACFVNDPIIKEYWIQHLPQNIQKVLAPIAKVDLKIVTLSHLSNVAEEAYQLVKIEKNKLLDKMPLPQQNCPTCECGNCKVTPAVFTCKCHMTRTDWFVKQCHNRKCTQLIKSEEHHCYVCHVNVLKANWRGHLNSGTHVKQIEGLEEYYQLPSLDVHTDYKTALAEGAFVFHNQIHGQPTYLMDCQSRVTKEVLDDSFGASAKKASKIFDEVYAPESDKQLKRELDQALCVGVSSDCTNRDSLNKLHGMIVRFFDPNEGLKLRLLDLDRLPGESSSDLTKSMMHSIKQFNIEDKINCLSGDCGAVNFGGVGRDDDNLKKERTYTRIYKEN